MAETAEFIRALATAVEGGSEATPIFLAGDRRPLIAQALRLLAASVDAEPVAYRYRLSPRDELWSYWEHPPSRPQFPRAITEPLYATLQPSPSYASGVAEGIEKAVEAVRAEIADVKAAYEPGDGSRPTMLTTLASCVGRIRALKEGE